MSAVGWVAHARHSDDHNHDHDTPLALTDLATPLRRAREKREAARGTRAGERRGEAEQQHSDGSGFAQLCPADKQRIARLIRELAAAGGEREALQSQLSVERLQHREVVDRLEARLLRLEQTLDDTRGQLRRAEEARNAAEDEARALQRRNAMRVSVDAEVQTAFDLKPVVARASASTSPLAPPAAAVNHVSPVNPATPANLLPPPRTSPGLGSQSHELLPPPRVSPQGQAHVSNMTSLQPTAAFASPLPPPRTTPRAMSTQQQDASGVLQTQEQSSYHQQSPYQQKQQQQRHHQYGQQHAHDQHSQNIDYQQQHDEQGRQQERRDYRQSQEQEHSCYPNEQQQRRYPHEQQPHTEQGRQHSRYLHEHEQEHSSRQHQQNQQQDHRQQQGRYVPLLSSPHTPVQTQQQSARAYAEFGPVTPTATRTTAEHSQNQAHAQARAPAATLSPVSVQTAAQPLAAARHGPPLLPVRPMALWELIGQLDSDTESLAASLAVAEPDGGEAVSSAAAGATERDPLHDALALSALLNSHPDHLRNRSQHVA